MINECIIVALYSHKSCIILLMHTMCKQHNGLQQKTVNNNYHQNQFSYNHIDHVYTHVWIIHKIDTSLYTMSVMYYTTYTN